MSDIINTLVVKEIKTRFYGDSLGYAWALIHPLAWIGALILFFSILGKQVPIFTDIISFLIPGMLSYILFRNTIQSIIRTKKTSKSLLYIQSITPLVVTLAGGLIELLNGVFVFLILMIVNYILFDELEYHDPLIMMYGYLCVWGIGLAVGHLLSELVFTYPAVEKILPLILRPVFWVSGVFYTANELPEWLLDIASMNPLFQAVEIIRDGTFFSYHSRMTHYYEPILAMTVIIGVTTFVKILMLKRDKIGARIY